MTTCEICYEDFTFDPTADDKSRLPVQSQKCSHSFCYNCARAFPKNECPNCRVANAFPPSQLQINLHSCELLQQLRQHPKDTPRAAPMKQQTRGRSRSPVKRVHSGIKRKQVDSDRRPLQRARGFSDVPSPSSTPQAHRGRSPARGTGTAGERRRILRANSKVRSASRPRATSPAPRAASRPRAQQPQQPSGFGSPKAVPQPQTYPTPPPVSSPVPVAPVFRPPGESIFVSQAGVAQVNGIYQLHHQPGSFHYRRAGYLPDADIIVFSMRATTPTTWYIAAVATGTQNPPTPDDHEKVGLYQAQGPADGTNFIPSNSWQPIDQGQLPAPTLHI